MTGTDQMNADVVPRARTVILGASVASLVTVVAARLLLIWHNVPFDPLAIPSDILGVIPMGTGLVLAFSLLAVALVSNRPATRGGLLFTGVFGVLALVGPATALPAAVALVAGAAVAWFGTIGVPGTYREIRRAALAGGFVSALAISLWSSLGFIEGGLQGLGGLVTLGTVTAVVFRAEDDFVALVTGAVTVLALVVASLTSPFVLGSSFLVGFAVVGVPHLLTALAVGAGVAVAVAGLRAGNRTLAVGAGLLIFAGVPVTFPRAMAVVLGATLVLLDVEALIGLETPDNGKEIA